MEKKSLLLATVLLASGLAAGASSAAPCRPTEPDMLGPFYKPGAPLRSSVGTGYLLQGKIRSSQDCSPVPRATIEFWLAGPDGQYDDGHRATVRSDVAGTYRFESELPPPYSGRPPHIHVRVVAQGYRTLVTQHYPSKGTNGAVADFVLVPLR
jgi:protocatechuate 3,4-dioxygenase beta subunit